MRSGGKFQDPVLQRFFNVLSPVIVRLRNGILETGQRPPLECRYAYEMHTGGMSGWNSTCTPYLFCFDNSVCALRAEGKLICISVNADRSLFSGVKEGDERQAVFRWLSSRGLDGIAQVCGKCRDALVNGHGMLFVF